MSRILSPYEIAWRKSVGHAVPADGVHHDEDDLEQLTAPAPVSKPVVPPVPAAETPPPPVEPPPAPAPAPSSAAKPGNPGKK